MTRVSGHKRRSASPADRHVRVVTALDIAVRAGLLIFMVLIAAVYAPFYTCYTVPKIALAYGAVAILWALMLTRWAFGGLTLPARVTALRWPALVFVLIMLAAFWGAHNRGQGVEAMVLRFGLMSCFLLAAWAAADAGFMRALFWSVSITAVPLALLGILQYFEIHLIPFPPRYPHLPVSTFGNTNFVAHYLELVIPVQVGLLLTRRTLYQRLILVPVVAISCWHMVLTRSDGGWMALGVAFLVIVLALGWRLPGRWKLALPTLVGLVGAVGLALLFWSVRVGTAADSTGPTGLGRKVAQLVQRPLTKETVQQRLILWTDTVALIRARPWLGVGPGNYSLLWPAYRSVDNWHRWRRLMGFRHEQAARAHNEYLELAAEIGVAGLAAFGAVLIVVAYHGIQAIRFYSPGSEQWYWAVSCLSALAAGMTHALVSFNWQDPTSAVYFWVLGGVLVATASSGHVAAAGESTVSAASPSGDSLRAGAVILAVLLVLAGGRAGLHLLRADHHYWRGLQYHRMDQPAWALVEFQQAIQWRSHDYRYHYMQARASRAAGRIAAAGVSGEAAVTLHPTYEPAWRLLGEVYTEMQDWPRARSALKRAVELDPLRPRTYEWLAWAQRQTRDHQAAIETWKRLLALKPDDASLMNSLSVEYASAGNMEAAIAVLEKAVRIHPSDLQARGNLGGLYLNTGRTADGETLLLDALASSPDEFGWRLMLARHYLENGHHARAAAQIEAVLTADPDHPAARRLAGKLELEEAERQP